MPGIEIDNQIVVCFLQMMADINGRLREFMPQLYERSQVKIVHIYDFAPKRLIVSPTVDGASDWELGSDFGVSAQLVDGSVIDWWLELWWNSKCWRVEYTIFRHDPDEDGCHAVVGFPVQEAAGIHGALGTVAGALDELFSTQPPNLFTLTPQAR